jgi:hypothetical protein
MCLALKNIYPEKDKKLLTRLRLIEMQDFILDILIFIKQLSDIVGGKKIILYPFNGYPGGFGISSAKGYIPTSDYLENIQKEKLTDWKLPRSNKFKDIGLVFPFSY